MGYDFGNDSIKGGIATGIVFALISSLSSISGYYKLNLPYYEHVIVPEDKRSEVAHRIKRYNLPENVLLFITNAITAIPLTYAAHKEISKFINLYGAIVFDVPTYISLYLIYERTANEFIYNLNNFIYARKFSNTVFAVEDAQPDLNIPPQVMRQKVTLHITTLIDYYRSLPDTEIDNIHRIIINKSEEESETMLDAKLVSLLFPSSDLKFYTFICSNSDIPKRVFGYIGALIGLGGTYFFYSVSTTSFNAILKSMGVEDNIADITSKVIASGVFGARSMFGAITGKTTFENLYLLCKRIFHIKNDASKVKDIALPSITTILAAVSASSYVQLALNYTGKDPLSLTLNVFNGISSFTKTFWSLKSVSDSFFRSSDHIKRDEVINSLKKIIDILPYLKVEVVKELYASIQKDLKVN